MEILSYYDLDKNAQQSILAQMSKCGWDAGDYLKWLLEKDEVFRAFGETSKVYLLVEGGRLASFCTYAEQDEIDDRSMVPWIGFVFTFPEYRGRRCAGQLIEKCVETARGYGFDKIYVSSEEKGLYEKYGFTYLCDRESIHDYMTQIFVREI